MRVRLPVRTRTQFVYGDESGGFKNEPYFLLGIILTYEPTVHDHNIEALRQKSGYQRQFEYKKTDRCKTELCKDVIDYFVQADDLELQSLLIPTHEHDLTKYRRGFDTSGRKPEVTAYNYRYKQLILQNTSVRDDLVVILDSRARAREDNLPEYLQSKIDNIKNIQLVDSAKHNLIQLVDLLIGSVYGDLTNTSHPVKRELVDFLKGKLKVPHFTEVPLRLTRKFRVTEWRPPRTRR